MREMKLLWVIIKRSGAGKVALGFLVAILVCAGIVTLVEQDIITYGDGLWYCWAVITTVGLGDFTATTAVGRLASVSLSIFAVIAIAILTAVIVDYFNERRAAQRNEALSEFLDKLERLPELDKEELQEIADHVRSLR